MLSFSLSFFLFTIYVASTTTITVSGVSSGGSMATQYGVAHSSTVSGVGVIAGTHYYCAETVISYASCLSLSEYIDPLDAVSHANTLATQGEIDATSNIASQRIFLFSGVFDVVVETGAVSNVEEFYEAYVTSTSQISFVDTELANHAWITDTYGNACVYLGLPYINDCNYDLAGNMLAFFYNTQLNARDTNWPSSNLQTINQASFVPNGQSASFVGLQNTAYIYVPTGCTTHPISVNCDIHIMYHGCTQTTTLLGDLIPRKAGLNEWAETNDIIVLYPQARATSIWPWPYNPSGCWDWWGYTNSDYAVKSGPQIETVYNMVQWIINP